MNTASDYVGELIAQFWDYAEAESFLGSGLLQSDERQLARPPVFRNEADSNNILIAPNADEAYRSAIVSSLPVKEKHRHFASMRSSQALAQSVFGNLIVCGNLKLLEGLLADEGIPAFNDDLERASLQLEYNVNHLGEPRPTSVDAWIQSDRRVAVECKLSESDFGTCSRPKLRREADKNYERDFCDGSYSRQRNRRTRCSLTEIGVDYWRFIPELFNWKNDQDMTACNLRNTYQLVRNVLAACVTPNGIVDPSNSHALIVYDSRNPAFQKGGVAHIQLLTAQAALKAPDVLRSCSWQSLVRHLEDSGEVPWLADKLRSKYGF